jgi:hypothetical protein
VWVKVMMKNMKIDVCMCLYAWKCVKA